MANPLKTIDGDIGTPATLTSMRRLMDSMFDTMLLPDLRFELGTEPAVNLSEKNGTYTLECALPGYRKEDITIEARGDAITITGSAGRDEREERPRYHRHEVERRAFTRTIALPSEIDPESIAAKFENGLLEITMRPNKRVVTKTIPIAG
jgi:HSP20 family protein